MVCPRVYGGSVCPSHLRRRKWQSRYVKFAAAHAAGFALARLRPWVFPRSPFSANECRWGCPGWGSWLALVGRSRPLDTIRNNSRIGHGVSRRQPQPRLLLPTAAQRKYSWFLSNRSGEVGQPPPPPPWRAQPAAAYSAAVGCGVCAAAPWSHLAHPKAAAARWRALTVSIFGNFWEKSVEKLLKNGTFVLFVEIKTLKRKI